MAEPDHTEPTPKRDKTFEELDKLASEGNLTPDDLQLEIKRYTKAYQEEFEEAEAASNDLSKTAENLETFWKQNAVLAAGQIVYLAHNAESETVRANMLRFIVERAEEDSTRDGDPMAKILERLTSSAKAGTS
jgi:sigma54-dependent transcription regulator